MGETEPHLESGVEPGQGSRGTLGALSEFGPRNERDRPGEELEMVLLGKEDPTSLKPEEDLEVQNIVTPKPDFPWRNVLLISMASCTDFIVQAMYLPIYPALCQEFYHAKNLGVCVGVLNGMINLGTALTATFMGFFSDNIGRKLPMLWGLLVGMVAVCIVVTSHSFIFTAATLCFTGMMDPILPISKSAIADVTSKSNRARAYGVRATSSAFGRTWWILLMSFAYGSGVTIGGNPFLFSGIVGVSFYAIIIVACCIWLPETHPVLGGGTVPKFRILFSGGGKVGSPSQGSVRSQQQSDDDADNKPHKQSGATVESSRSGGAKGKNGDFVMGYRFHEGALFTFLNPVLRQVFFITFCQTAANSAVQTVLVLYMRLPAEDGGLGLSRKIMMYMLVTYFGFGTISLVFVYPRLCARYSLRKVYTIYQGGGAVASLIMVFAHAFVKFTNSTINYADIYTDVRVTMILTVVLCLQGFTLANMPVSQSLIANASDPTLQGLTTGMSQVVIALGRSTIGGPLWFGWLFAKTAPLDEPWLVWLAIGALQAYTVLGIIMIKEKPRAAFSEWLRERHEKRGAGKTPEGFVAMTETGNPHMATTNPMN